MDAAKQKPLIRTESTPPSKPTSAARPTNLASSDSAFLLPPDRLFKTILAQTQTAVATTLDFLNDAPSRPLINPDARVLHIGDSHTVGTYGKEMDKMFRETGAKVRTYGSAGSSPNWWFNGTTTHSGFYSKDDEGKVDSPADWRTPHKTPKLNTLIQDYKPNVIVISLGANLLGAKGDYIEKEVRKMAEVAKTSGAKIVWVGPPDGRESKKPTSKQAQLYEHLQKVAHEYGTFIDSRPFTEYPATGGDGVHYGGKEGTKIAKNWAKEVFAEIQRVSGN